MCAPPSRLTRRPEQGALTPAGGQCCAELEDAQFISPFCSHLADLLDLSGRYDHAVGLVSWQLAAAPTAPLGQHEPRSFNNDHTKCSYDTFRKFRQSITAADKPDAKLTRQQSGLPTAKRPILLAEVRTLDSNASIVSIPSAPPLMAGQQQPAGGGASAATLPAPPPLLRELWRTGAWRLFPLLLIYMSGERLPVCL